MRPAPWALCRSLLLLALPCALLSGCGPKLTQEKIEKIKLGMSEDEVIAILGKGRSVSSVADVSSDLPGMPKGHLENLLKAQGECRKWSSGNTVLVVRFENGKVTGSFSYGRSSK